MNVGEKTAGVGQIWLGESPRYSKEVLVSVNKLTHLCFLSGGYLLDKHILLQYKANILPGFFYILIFFIFAFTIQNVRIIVLHCIWFQLV